MQYKTELKNYLTAIYHLGDEDECSWKHIGHGFASLIKTGDWVNTIDYSDPFGGDFTDDDFARLDELWANVEFITAGLSVADLTELAVELSQEDGRLMMLDRYLDEYEGENNDN